MVQPKNVLLVDDNEVDNFINKKVLSAYPSIGKITIKTSAKSALEFLKSHSATPSLLPDVIFLDISMPELDGFGFLNEFSKLPPDLIDKCHIIMLTSSEDEMDRKKAMLNPCVKKYLLKPLSSYKLEEFFSMSN
jgi:CheY-like chemotaxis protein